MFNVLNILAAFINLKNDKVSFRYWLKNSDTDASTMIFNLYLPIPILRPISNFIEIDSVVTIHVFTGMIWRPACLPPSRKEQKDAQCLK